MLILAPGREKSLRRRHVWIFSGAIAALEGNPAPGETVVVVDSERRFLARAAWSPESQLAARVWSFDPDEPIDAAFFRRRVRNAVEFRRFLRLDAPSGGCRLIHSEGDALPGLIADRYGEFIVVQFLSTGTERFRSEIVDALRRLLKVGFQASAKRVAYCQYLQILGKYRRSRRKRHNNKK